MLAGLPFAHAQEAIRIGVLEDQSGDFAAATTVKVHAIELAAEEINAEGGIDGRAVELVVYDTQSDNRRYQEFMRRVLQRDKVDVVFAAYFLGGAASTEALDRRLATILAWLKPGGSFVFVEAGPADGDEPIDGPGGPLWARDAEWLGGHLVSSGFGPVVVGGTREAFVYGEALAPS